MCVCEAETKRGGERQPILSSQYDRDRLTRFGRLLVRSVDDGHFSCLVFASKFFCIFSFFGPLVCPAFVVCFSHLMFSPSLFSLSSHEERLRKLKLLVFVSHTSNCYSRAIIIVPGRVHSVTQLQTDYLLVLSIYLF